MGFYQSFHSFRNDRVRRVCLCDDGGSADFDGAEIVRVNFCLAVQFSGVL